VGPRAHWWCLLAVGLSGACGKASSDVFNDPEPGGESGGVAASGAGGRIAQGGLPNEPSTGGRLPRGGSASGGNQTGGDDGEPVGGAGDAGGEASGGKAASGGNRSSGGSATGGKKGSGGNSGGGGARTGGAPSTGGASGGAGNQEDPAEPLTKAFCATVRKCCDVAGMGTGALSDCEAQLAVQLLNFELTRDGLLEMDATALDACVAAIDQANTSCVLTGLPLLCRRVWRGTKPAGEPCTDVSQCDRSNGPKACLRNLETGSQSDPGVCADLPHGQNTEPCSQSCAEGADCSTNFSSFEAEPVTALCHEADGVYCNAGDDEATCAPLTARGSPCDSPSQCAAADFCDTTCQPRSNLGGACTSSFGCSTDLLCIDGECAGAPLATAELCAGNLSGSGLN
jgi:hypothetical protein